jgi:geranylgeranyl diphosphate synthase type II
MVLTDDMQASSKEAAFDLQSYLKNRQAKVEEALALSLPVVYPEKIYESMRYSLMAGGKRLRPILCLTTCELVGGTIEMAMPTACALEMIHTMSLIHDDLPAMDNDDYRRGKLTNHKVFGEAVAILAGDGLLSYAFEHLAAKTQGVSPEHLLRVVAVVGRAVSAAGLVGGQVVDLESEGKTDVTLETLNFIHQHKTAALLEASVISGAILAGATEEQVSCLSRYAQHIGLAFQIVDDILDITSTSEALGKSVGKDLQAKKVTYPSLWGLEKSKEAAQQLVRQAKEEVTMFGEAAIPLMAIADFIICRTH